MRAHITGNDARNSITGGSDYPSFDGNGAQLAFVNVTSGAQAQLVGSGATAQAQMLSDNPATSSSRVYANGVTLIPGPITTPP